ncbi:hypothetical protein F66182_5141 [Fusarium sp. NRRL 66182]|nr:hypothetical protein F66182_5141 [Fusarium sp. NRRL 66182]
MESVHVHAAPGPTSYREMGEIMRENFKYQVGNFIKDTRGAMRDCFIKLRPGAKRRRLQQENSTTIDFLRVQGRNSSDGESTDDN